MRVFLYAEKLQRAVVLPTDRAYADLLWLLAGFLTQILFSLTGYERKKTGSERHG